MEESKNTNVTTPRPLPFANEQNGEGKGGRSFGGDNIDAVIMGGITFKGGGKSGPKKDENKVKTKAKKKQYITGAHGSGAAKKKAEIRMKRANRHK